MDPWNNTTMLTTGMRRTSLLAMLIVAVASGGCDKMKRTVAGLGKLKETKASANAAATVPYSRTQVTSVNQAGFAGFIARDNAVVLIDFNATWCGPCKMLGPILEKAAEQHPGVVYVGKVDVDQERALASSHDVRSIPDVRIYKDGREVDRFVGFPGEKVVLAKIAHLAEGITPMAAPVTPPATPVEAQVKPFQKGWLPAGMSRKQEAAPGHPAKPNG